MPVFVVLALAVFAMSAGAAVVAALQVVKAAKRTREAVAAARDRVRPLAEELRAELAVTSTEVEALGERASALGAMRDRRGRPGNPRAA